jgi:hypothetical protein
MFFFHADGETMGHMKLADSRLLASHAPSATGRRFPRLVQWADPTRGQFVSRHRRDFGHAAQHAIKYLRVGIARAFFEVSYAEHGGCFLRCCTGEQPIERDVLALGNLLQFSV